MIVIIREDRVDTAPVIAVLTRHLEVMRSTTPPEHVHALDLDALGAPDVTLWTARREDLVIGCGALKELDAAHGEIKSMHVLAEHRGTGAGAALVDRIVAEARCRGYARASLETGCTDAFEPARALYRRHGFVDCGPFASYVRSEHSAFMTKALTVPEQDA